MNYILQMTVILSFFLLLVTCIGKLKRVQFTEEETENFPYELQLETYQGKARGGRLYQFYKKRFKLESQKEMGLSVGRYYIGNGMRNDILIPESGQPVRLMLHLNGESYVTVLKGQVEVDGTIYEADRSSMIPLTNEDKVTSEISTGSCSINVWKKR